jgi:hypothetical protein
MALRDCINNLTHSLLQQGDGMRQRQPGPPPSVSKDLTSSTSGDGQATRSDAKNQPFTPVPGAHGTGGTHAGTSTSTPGSTLTARGLHYQEAAFNKRQREYTSRVHQPMPMLVIELLAATCQKLHVERLSLPGQPGHNYTNIYAARKDRYHIYNNIYVVITDTVSTVTRYDK